MSDIEISPIHKELIGRLNEAPDPSTTITINDKSLWEHYNGLVDRIIEITKDESFRTYTIAPQSRYYKNITSYFVETVTYRSTLSGLINKLQSMFHLASDKTKNQGPRTVIQQTNSQTQSMSTQLILQLGGDLQKAEEKTKDKNEKSFIENIKQKIGGLQSYVEFANLVVTLALKHNIALDRLKDLFAK